MPGHQTTIGVRESPMILVLRDESSLFKGHITRKTDDLSLSSEIPTKHFVDKLVNYSHCANVLHMSGAKN
jgi:hypothetical protein